MDKFTITQECHCGCNEIIVQSSNYYNEIVLVKCIRCGSTCEVFKRDLQGMVVKVKELWDKDRLTKQSAITTQDVCWVKWQLEKGGKSMKILFGHYEGNYWVYGIRIGRMFIGIQWYSKDCRLPFRA